MLEHYRYVYLIPLLPFLFLEIILFLNGIGIFRFPQLLLEPVGWSNSQHFSLSSRHHYHLNVPSNMTADSNNLCLRLCMHVCVSVHVMTICVMVLSVHMNMYFN